MRTRCAGILCSLIVTGIFLWFSDLCRAESAAIAGRVAMIRGEVTATDAGKTTRKLSQDGNVQVGDRLATGAGARLKVELTDGTAMFMGERSTLVIDEYLFNKSDPAGNSCSLRFVNGVSRLVTGSITRLNPDRFKIRSSFATIGIRGCETGIRGNDRETEVLVMSLGSKESVVILTSKDGSLLMKPDTGERIVLDRDKIESIQIDKEGTGFVAGAGRRPVVAPLKADDLKKFVELTSCFPPAQYDIIRKDGDTVLRLKPAEPATQKGDDSVR